MDSPSNITTHLLAHCNSKCTEHLHRQDEIVLEKLSVDEIIETYVGGFGAAQILQILLFSLVWLFDCQHTFVTIFTDAQPSWRCSNNSYLNDDHQNYPVSPVVKFSDGMNCTAESSICSMDPRAWEWVRGKEASVVSEWDLVCYNTLRASLPQSLFFIGSFLGGFTMGTLADSSFGRKRMLQISCLIISVTGFLTAVSPNIWIYALLRALSGFGRAAICNCCLVLCTELVGCKWRGVAGFCGFVFATLGFISLPGIAYVARFSSWRNTYIWISILPMLYSFFVLPFLWESPRWLLTRGRVDEALQTLRRMAELNRKSIVMPLNIGILMSTNSSTSEPKAEGHASALKSLWKTKWARTRMMKMMVVGLGVGLLYFGMPLGVGNLDFNLYVGVVLNALAEIPAAIISTILIAKAERRICIVILTLGSGMLCIACILLSGRQHVTAGNKNWGEMGAELGAFLCATTAFNVVLIYCLELFPTSVRNSAMSMVRQAIIVGGGMSPVLSVAGRRIPHLSLAVFGIASSVCGFFVLGLPDTRNRPLYATLEEQELNESRQPNEIKTGYALA